MMNTNVRDVLSNVILVKQYHNTVYRVHNIILSLYNNMVLCLRVCLSVTCVCVSYLR